MGKPDTLDRVAQLLIALVALIALVNGAFMLWDPFGWYQAVGTVKFTGPPNQHFIRDIGLAYLSAAAVLGYAACDVRGRWLAAITGALWLAVHGLLHLWEVLTGICAPSVFWQDAPGVLGPPILVVLAVGIVIGRTRMAPGGLPKRVFVTAFDRLTNGTSPFIHDLAAAPGFATEKFQHFMPASMHRHEAPADMFHMARIAATLVEDCGPCALLAAQGALSDGVDRDLVNAALAANPPDGDLTLAFAFGASIAQQSAEAAVIGDKIEAVHGRHVRTELALTAATVRAYPALKRGLGYGQACALTKLEV